MRGRIASFALGAAMSRRRNAWAVAEQEQREIEQSKADQDRFQQREQKPQASDHDDLAEKLQKYADLHHKGVLTDEEFQKLKTDLLAKL